MPSVKQDLEPLLIAAAQMRGAGLIDTLEMNTRITAKGRCGPLRGPLPVVPDTDREKPLRLVWRPAVSTPSIPSHHTTSLRPFELPREREDA